MSSMINYYEKLHLSQDMAADDLDFELIKQEKIWRKRELSQPEKAADMIALITGARKVFRSDEAKARYDEDLRKSMEEPAKEEPDAERKALFEKWLEKADGFYSSGDTDLAESAMDKAMSYYDEKSENTEFLFKAANTFAKADQTDKALQCINRALMIDQNNWEFHALKGQILAQRGDAAGAEDAFIKAGTVAERNSDANAIAYMNGVMSYFRLTAGGKTSEAYALADKAAAGGDPSGFGAIVLEKLNSSKAHPVTLAELNDYSAEAYFYGAEVGEIAGDIIRRFTPASGDEWVICTKTTRYNDYEEGSLDYTENDELHRYKIVLCTDGNIKGYKMSRKKGSRPGWEPMSGGANSILMETDFDALWTHVDTDNPAGMFDLYSTSVSEAWGKLASGQIDKDKDLIMVTRKTYKKGYGLYTRLMDLRSRLEAEERRRTEEAQRQSYGL